MSGENVQENDLDDRYGLTVDKVINYHVVIVECKKDLL